MKLFTVFTVKSPVFATQPSPQRVNPTQTVTFTLSATQHFRCLETKYTRRISNRYRRLEDKLDEITARDDHVLSENPCKRIIFTED